MSDTLQEIKEIAADNDIAQYKAAMLEYLEASKTESAAKAKKERLKRMIESTMSRIHHPVEAIGIPETDQFAVAFHYTQEQSKWDAEVAEKLLTADVLGQIRKKVPVVCFTVKAMSEEAMLNKISNIP
jgi:hypothetical protein